MMKSTTTGATLVARDTIVEAYGVTRDFRAGNTNIVHALRGIDMKIEPGEFIALRGRSGSGKTTLINILIGLDDPTQGQVIVLGKAMSKLEENARAKLRRESIGMMFQNAHLFPSLTAQENVEIPLRLAHVDPAERTRLAQDVLKRVGLALVCTIAASNYPAVSSSAWHWRVRSCISRASLSPTSQPATSTPSLAATSRLAGQDRPPAANWSARRHPRYRRRQQRRPRATNSGRQDFQRGVRGRRIWMRKS